MWTNIEVGAVTSSVGLLGAVIVATVSVRKQGKISAASIKSQAELADLQHRHARFDRKADASVGIIRVLLLRPEDPVLMNDLVEVARYEQALKTWLNDYLSGIAPLVGFADEKAVEELTDRYVTLKLAAEDVIHQAERAAPLLLPIPGGADNEFRTEHQAELERYLAEAANSHAIFVRAADEMLTLMREQLKP